MGWGSEYPGSGLVAGPAKEVMVSPTFILSNSLTPVIRYPTSPVLKTIRNSLGLDGLRYPNLIRIVSLVTSP